MPSNKSNSCRKQQKRKKKQLKNDLCSVLFPQRLAPANLTEEDSFSMQPPTFVRNSTMGAAMGMRIALDRLRSVTKFARKNKIIYKLLQKPMPLGKGSMWQFLKCQNFYLLRHQKPPPFFSTTDFAFLLQSGLTRPLPLLLVILNLILDIGKCINGKNSIMIQRKPKIFLLTLLLLLQKISKIKMR